MTDTVQIVFSLSRLHKIAERASEACSERVQEISRLAYQRASSVEDFDAAKAKALKDAERIERLSAERAALASVVSAVRSALGKANAQHGVSDLLCAIETERREIAALTPLAGVSVDDVAAVEKVVARRREAAASILSSGSANAAAEARRERYENVVFSVVSDAARESAVESIRLAKLRVAALSDKLADANATRISVDVDARAAALLGLV